MCHLWITATAIKRFPLRVTCCKISIVYLVQCLQYFFFFLCHTVTNLPSNTIMLRTAYCGKPHLPKMLFRKRRASLWSHVRKKKNCTGRRRSFKSAVWFELSIFCMRTGREMLADSLPAFVNSLSAVPRAPLLSDTSWPPSGGLPCGPDVSADMWHERLVAATPSSRVPSTISSQVFRASCGEQFHRALGCSTSTSNCVAQLKCSG